MSEQNGGPNEASEAGSKPDINSRPDGSKPRPEPDTPLASHTDEPVIDAAAEEAQADHGDHLVDPQAPAEDSTEPLATEGELVEEPVIDSEAGEALQTEAAAESSAEEEEEFAEQEKIPEPAAVKPRKTAIFFGRRRRFKPRRICRLEPICLAAQIARAGRHSGPGSGCGAAQTRRSQA